jgi:hypothetical protein
LIPIIKEFVAPAEKTDVVKDTVLKFSDGIPVFMDALDGLAKVHPIISGTLIQ